MDTPLYHRAHKLLQHGLDLLFPPHCASCRCGGHLLCPACLRTMQPLAAPLCQHCGMPLATTPTSCTSCQRDHFRLDGLRCVNFYQGALRQAIHALKYAGQQRLAEPLGLLLAQAFIAYGLRADGIVPLPLHAQRQQQRGYNQAVLLARVCAAHLKLPCLEDLVIRQRATRAQVELARQERWQNVSGAFALAPGVKIRSLAGHRLLLIDDVCTTGASLEACAAPLYAAGAQEVWGLVLGRPVSQTQDSMSESAS
jgi:ComF family protein